MGGSSLVTSLTDITLLQRWAVSRDADAFSEIVRRHSGMVYATTLRILRNPVEAEDVVQECFIKLATADESIRSSLGGWLHSVATTHALDRIRSNQRRLRRDTTYAQKRPDSVELAWEDIREHIDEIIALLPEKYRSAVIAHFLEGRTYDSLSESMGIPRTTAAYRVHKGVELIRRALSRRGITAASATLAALLAAHTATAAPPPSLAASLGRLAIAGPTVRARSPRLSRAISTASWRNALLGAGVLLGLVMLFWVSGAGKEQAKTATQKMVFLKASEPAHSAQALDTTAGTTSSQTRSRLPESSFAGAETTDPQDATQASLVTISGRVTDDQSEAISGASVCINLSDDVGAYLPIKQYGVQTKTDGTYSVQVLPGTAAIYAHAPGRTMQMKIGAFLKKGNDYPSIDFDLRPSRAQISGTVVDASGNAIPHATVHVRTYDIDADGGGTSDCYEALDFIFAECDNRGAFVLDLPSDKSADLMAWATGYAPRFFRAVRGGSSANILQLRRGGGIAGAVKRADGTPVAGAQVYVFSRTSSEQDADAGWLMHLPRGNSGAEATVLNTKSIEPVRLPRKQVTTSNDGTYRVEDLSDEYSYCVYASDNDAIGNQIRPAVSLSTVSSHGTVGELAVMRDVRVHSGSTMLLADLVLGQTATVQGRVTDRTTGEGIGGVLICGFFAKTANCVVHTTITQSDGTYALVLPADEGDSAYLALFLPCGATFSCIDSAEIRLPLLPGEARTIDFAEDAPFSAPFRVVYSDGAPAAKMYFTLHDVTADQHRSFFDMATDAEGRYTFRGLIPTHEYEVDLGARTAQGTAPPLLISSDRFTGNPGETLPETVLTCEHLGGIAGTALSVESQPLWDKAIQIEGSNPRTGAPIAATARTNAEGRFVVQQAFPEGFYSQLTLRLRRAGAPQLATVNNIVIVRNQVTELGPITVVPDLEDPTASTW